MRTDQTIAVRPGQELDAARVGAALRERIPGLSGDPEVRQFASGMSNLTYLLTFGERRLILRRPPPGTKARSSHQMWREFALMNALKSAYTVPVAWFHTEDESLLGAEYYVMDHVLGQVVGGPELPAEWGFGAADARRLCERLWDSLAQLHLIDPAAVRLGAFGRPEGYVRRQIDGWCGRYVNAVTPDVPDYAEVRSWLAAHVPEEAARASVIHGDYRLDNCVLALDDPCRILAVLDWELGTVGDPLMDLGSALAYWTEAGDDAWFRERPSQPSTVAGMMTRREIFERYREQLGLEASWEQFQFHLLYGFFRNAVIVQQIYYRYFHGESRDERFAGLAERVVREEQRCRALLDTLKS
jgi:aminoglycoside phosphotransferase (APT) family kinase protein